MSEAGSQNKYDDRSKQESTLTCRVLSSQSFFRDTDWVGDVAARLTPPCKAARQNKMTFHLSSPCIPTVISSQSLRHKSPAWL
jgi:hypothetical protein